MAGKLWMAADGGKAWLALARRARLPLVGADGRPDARDAVLEAGARRANEAALGSGWCWRLNGEAAALGGADGGAAAALRRLRWAGLRTAPTFGYGIDAGVLPAGGSGAAASTSAAGLRHYAVPVFHLEALAVQRIDSASMRLPADWDGRHPLFRRLSAAAVKAVYALGLDYATVRLTADDAGAVAVSGVSLEPGSGDEPLWLAAWQRFREAFAEHRRVREEVSESGSPGTHWDANGKGALQGLGQGTGTWTGTGAGLLIGADPEFVMLGGDGRIVSADRYFPVHGAAGSDALRTGGRVIRPIAELRPDPARDPDGLTRNVRQLLARAARLAPGAAARWLAGAMPVPGLALGGHLHLSGAWLNARLLRVLDSCVALPLAAGEDPAGRGRRPRYGALGDHRSKPHGFEYRTPPSWLVSPTAARAAFALTLLAAREYERLAHALGRLPAEDDAGRRAYYEGDRGALLEIAERMHAAIRDTDSYAALERHIAPYFAAIGRGAVWSEQADIRPKWRIPIH